MFGIGEAPAVRIWHILVALGLLAQGSIGGAEPTGGQAISTARQLSGLGDQEAEALIAKLEHAQSRLRAGEFQPFELLAGSIASYDMTNISPRDAFLQLPFREVWNIERVRTGNSIWQPYKLAYAPRGLGQLYWDIEVVLGFNGNIERVLMVYKPPSPF